MRNHAARGNAFRLELAGKSYAEVLDATKHQDDKIGRFLTAIAFLFTGAIAFLARSDVLSLRVVIDQQSRPLPGLLLGLFLILAVIAVLLLLVALGPNLNLPRPERLGGRPSSLLFFLSMAGSTLEEWQDKWRYPSPAPEEALQTYVRETHNLAVKTDFKYDRTNEARAVFTLALMFLALSIVLLFESESRSAPSAPLEWNPLTRYLVATVIAVFAFVVSYDYFELEQELGNYVETKKKWFRYRSLFLLLVAAPGYIVALTVPGSQGALSVGRWIALGCVVLAGVSLLSRTVSPAEKLKLEKRWSVMILGVSVVLALITWRLFGEKTATSRLLLAAIAVVLLELPRFLVATIWWLRRVRLLKERREAASK